MQIKEAIAYLENNKEHRIASIYIRIKKMAINALKKQEEYENLEKQGLLLKLPCKVGDVVWCLEEDGYAGYVFLAISEEYYIVSPHYTHCDCINEQLSEMEDDTEHWGYASLNVIHKDKIFLTKEEAEQALKKLQEGE